jgi:hypothetical protein
MALGSIYMIRHNITGRMYIGLSSNVPNRIKQHFWKLRRGKHTVEDMQEDFDNYGDDFSVTILCENGGGSTEIEMMEKYQSCVRGIGYNYKDPHVTTKMRNATKRRSRKAMICKLVSTLDDNQAEYAYTLLSKIFGDKTIEKGQYI